MCPVLLKEVGVSVLVATAGMCVHGWAVLLEKPVGLMGLGKLPSVAWLM